MHNIVLPRLRTRGSKLGIFLTVVGVTVMRQMKIPEPQKRHEQDETGQPSGPFVNPYRPKRGLVGALVAKREQEHQQDALSDYGYSPKRPTLGNPDRGQQKRTGIHCKVSKPLGIGPFGQPCFLLLGNAVKYVLMGRHGAMRPHDRTTVKS